MEPEVGVVTLAPSSVNIKSELPGRALAFEIAEIRPQVGGIIIKRNFVEGDKVSKGESLYQIDPATAKPLSRQVSNGVATKLIRGTASKKEQSQVGITLWDVVDHTEFKNGLSKRVQSDRFETLKGAFNQEGLIRVKLAEYRIVNNEDEALNYAAEAMKRGEEGIIVKDLNGIYEHKRSKSSLKIKAVIDNEFVITGFEYGKGKYENMIGALCCESADGSVKFNVGSGLTDSDRTELLNESIVGKIVTVRHNGKIPNSNGTGFTLFLPRFVEIRHDKNEADTI